jgi:hypothetical protein
MNFFVIFLIMLLPIGGFFGVITWIRNDEEPKAKQITKTVLAVLVMTTIVSGTFCLGYNADLYVWNDGKCPTCNSEWNFESVARGKNSTVYYYECEQCHEVIKQNYLK